MNQEQQRLSNSLKFEHGQAAGGVQIHFYQLNDEDSKIMGKIFVTGQEQNQVLDQQIHLTYKQIYKKITTFAVEQTYHENNGSSYFGQTSIFNCTMNGELLMNVYFIAVLNKISIDQGETIKKFAYVTNLGISMLNRVFISSDHKIFDRCSYFQNLVLQNLLRRFDQRKLMNKIQGNTPDNCLLRTEHQAMKIIIPIKFCCSDSTQKVLRTYQGQMNIIDFDVEIKPIEQLIICTRNMSTYDWTANKRILKCGFLLQEVFLNQEEAELEMQTQTSTLIEQNLEQIDSFKTQNQSINISKIINCCKYLYFGFQKKKYLNKYNYLAYYPTIEGYDYRDQLLQKASRRFILKFASYKLTRTDPNDVLYFDADANGFLLSMFDRTYGGYTVKEINKNYYSIQKIFEKIKPKLYNENFYTGFSTEDFLIKETMSMKEASIPFDLGTNLIGEDCLLSHLPQIVYGEYKKGTTADGTYYSSLYSNQYTTTNSSMNKFSENFSANPTASNFNEGLDDFDIQVTLWDNFGQNLDRTGEIILESSLIIHSMQRFKISEIYLKTLHQFEKFPGKNLEGINLYSFAQYPELIQPSGHLNLSSPDVYLEFQSVGESGDQILIGAVSYNMIDYTPGNQMTKFKIKQNITF